LKARPVPWEPQEQAAPLGRYDVQQKNPNPSEQPLRLGVEALISLRGRRRCNKPSPVCSRACAAGEVSGKSAARADETPDESHIKAAKASTNRKYMMKYPRRNQARAAFPHSTPSFGRYFNILWVARRKVAAVLRNNRSASWIGEATHLWLGARRDRPR
jgi:hypothetical protein